MTRPCAVDALVVHRRHAPFVYEFSNRTPMWLVDIEDPNSAFPRWLRAFASIRNKDHFSDDDQPLSQKVRRFLAAQDVDWTAHHVLMLVNARSLGYVFDPLTTYFCFDAADKLEGILAEVHNTYGQRHCYPLPVGTNPTMSVEKGFYVSPFLAVEGRYDIRTKVTDTQVAVAITLTQGERTVFSASVQGSLQAATTGRVLRTIGKNPLPSQRVSAIIRWHGIRLWLRRLPVIPRRNKAPKGMV